VFIAVIVFKSNEWISDYQLNNYGTKTFAQIKIVSFTGVHDQFEVNNIAYSFSTKDSVVVDFTSQTTNNNYVIADNKMPLYPEQEFEVIYSTKNPMRNKLNFYVPSIKTMCSYINEVSDTLIKLKYFCNQKNQKFKTIKLATLIFKNFSFDGLATILFYNENIVENFSHNSYKYSNFISKKEFVKILNEVSKSN